MGARDKGSNATCISVTTKGEIEIGMVMKLIKYMSSYTSQKILCPYQPCIKHRDLHDTHQTLTLGLNIKNQKLAQKANQLSKSPKDHISNTMELRIDLKIL